MRSEAPRSDNIMAKRFRFRLETVRKIRQRERDAQRLVVATKVVAAEAIRGQVGTLTKQMGDNEDGSRNARGAGPMTMNLLRRHVFHQAWLSRTIEAYGEQLDEKLEEVRVERDKLADASARLKVIEKLRQRQWESHKVELAREEIQAGDEAAQQIFRRTRPGAMAS